MNSFDRCLQDYHTNSRYYYHTSCSYYDLLLLGSFTGQANQGLGEKWGEKLSVDVPYTDPI